MTESNENARSAERAVSVEDQIAKAVSESLQLNNLHHLRFLKKLSRTLSIGVVALTGLSISLGAGLVLQSHRSIDRQYFASDSRTGRVIPLVPMDRPAMTDTAVLEWTMRCVEQAHSFDFLNYRNQLSSVGSECFTTTGWNGFAAALEKSGNLKEVTDKSMIATAVRTGTAVVIKKGLNPQTGIFTYIVRFPMNINYQGKGKMPEQRLRMTIMVERVSTSENINGLGISQIVGDPQ